ncbi:MAG: Trm112 family protein [bacterium]
MAIDKELLEILACPVSKKPLELSEDGDFLICRESKLVYRIEDDIPIMLVDEAIPLDEWEKSRS